MWRFCVIFLTLTTCLEIQLALTGLAYNREYTQMSSFKVSSCLCFFIIGRKFIYRHRTFTSIGIKPINYINKLSVN